MDSARTRLAYHLRRLRRERGLSQEELAHLARLDRVTIGLIERNSRGVLLATLDDLAVILQTDVGEFLAPIPPGREGEERPVRRVLPRVAASPTTRGQAETGAVTTRVSTRRGPKRKDEESE
jgi:transcriptional regulator with XRE-family HTH domain